MKSEIRKLAIEQIDRKLSEVRPLMNLVVPARGWIHAIRSSLGMSLRQLASRLGISPQSVGELEAREADGTITMKRLREAAEALDLQLVYFVIPREQSLEGMIEQRAAQVARSIVARTARTMELEDQQVSDERIEKAVKIKTEEMIRTMPRYLWD
ncbi:MAG: mobile mystery protein A [Bacteroidota bacterium]